MQNFQVQNLKQTDNQRLLNALESLSISIGFVSTAVEMVRDALVTPSSEACHCDCAAAEIAADPTQQRFDFETV